MLSFDYYDYWCILCKCVGIIFTDLDIWCLMRCIMLQVDAAKHRFFFPYDSRWNASCGTQHSTINLSYRPSRASIKSVTNECCHRGLQQQTQSCLFTSSIHPKACMSARYEQDRLAHLCSDICNKDHMQIKIFVAGRHFSSHALGKDEKWTADSGITADNKAETFQSLSLFRLEQAQVAIKSGAICFTLWTWNHLM